jgi:predicted AAA+ superfamily ATPase
VYRKIYSKITEFKKSGFNKPIMVLGARQVGKTYILDSFCKNEFKNYIYINLFERKDVVDLYNTNLTSDEKFSHLKILLNFDLEKEDTILFIDEIQESEALISELKYFCERRNNVKIVCAGSLLGVKLKRSRFSFPVGKVRIINMYPMDFEEFLIALGQDLLIDEIRKSYNNNSSMLESLHIRAMNLYRIYLISGGMPESVQNIVDINMDMIKYDFDILSNIVESYFKDMDKYVISNVEALKIERTYRSIPSQLANRSNKFQFSKIVKGATSREYSSSLDWLEASNLLIKSDLVSTALLPLKGYVKDGYFKLFMNDVGILSNILELKIHDVLSDNISLYKGIIAENYVANQLLANGHSLYYWMSNGIAEVDFLIYTNDGIIPLEVKAGDTTKSKSLNTFVEKYKPKYSVRISSKNFGYDNNIKSIPLYAVFCIKD